MLVKTGKPAKLARPVRLARPKFCVMTIYDVERNGMSNAGDSTSDFTVLEKQVLHLREVTAKHAAMVAAVAEVARKIGEGRTRFTAGEKNNIEAELKAAHTNVRQMCDKGLLQAEIEHVQGLVTGCEAYEAAVVRAAAGNEGEAAAKPIISPAIPPTTVEDIFEDVRDLVKKVPDEGEILLLTWQMIEMKKQFDFHYDDCRYKENGQQAYKVITDFVKAIKEKLGANDQNSQKVADFLIHFTFEVCTMLQSFGRPGASVQQRIQERLQTYYFHKDCPMALQLAKLKRHGVG
jgi:hypothetical protein